jgi:hypothetical protein
MDHSQSSAQPLTPDGSRSDPPDAGQPETRHTAPTLSTHNSSSLDIAKTSSDPPSTDAHLSFTSHPPPVLQNPAEGLLSPTTVNSPLRLLASASSTAANLPNLSDDPVQTSLSAPNAGASANNQTKSVDPSEAEVTDGRTVDAGAEEGCAGAMVGGSVVGGVGVEGSAEATCVVGGGRESGGGNGVDVETRQVEGALRGGVAKVKAMAKGRAKGAGRRRGQQQVVGEGVGVEAIATPLAGVEGRSVGEEKAAAPAKQIEDKHEAKRPTRARASVRGLSVQGPAAGEEPGAPQHSAVVGFLRDSRKRRLSFTLRGSGRPGKIRKVA